MYAFVTHTWNPIKGKCKYNCKYCLVVDTTVLMHDFSVKNIQDVKVGDKIVGINRRNHKGYYTFEFSDVINISKRKADTIKINTNDGNIECTPEHRLMGSTKNRSCSDWKQSKAFTPYENLRFIGIPSSETDELLIGWLKGFCDGDGCFFKHYNEYRTEYLGFEGICIDKKLRNSLIDVASMFGIELKVGIKCSSPKSWNKGKKNLMIFSRRSENVKKLKELIKFDSNRGLEFYKGYLAGMLDSDGSVSGTIVRISQSESANKIKYERIRTCLHALSIKYKEEKTGFLLKGGFDMRIKILFQFKPKHSKKSINLIKGFTFKGSKHSQINDISIGKENIDVYNLETSCGNFIANGFIVHNCYMKVQKQKPLRLVEKEFNDDLGKNNFIFVGSSTDMFAEDVPKEWISKVLEHCNKHNNKYLFQTKNTIRFKEFKKQFPKNSVFGTTLESDIDHKISDAPISITRALWLFDFKAKTKMISIEPIMDFDFVSFIFMIRKINPEWVVIGADSKNHGLKEPSKEKILKLIEELKKFTEVKIKDNLIRLIGK